MLSDSGNWIRLFRLRGLCSCFFGIIVLNNCFKAADCAVAPCGPTRECRLKAGEGKQRQLCCSCNHITTSADGTAGADSRRSEFRDASPNSLCCHLHASLRSFHRRLLFCPVHVGVRRGRIRPAGPGTPLKSVMPLGQLATPAVCAG